MRAWLEGDFGSLDLRSEIDLLREEVRRGAEDGVDLRPFWAALARANPVACAELAAGPKAVAHPASVEACLVALDALERVLSPAGLYARLEALSPRTGATLLETAARRHPGAEWINRLSRRADPVPGRRHLLVAAAEGRLREACEAVARGWLVPGLVAAARELPSVEPGLALLRAGEIEGALDALAAALDAGPHLPVVACVAAIWGPEPDPLLARLAPRLVSPEARERLASTARDLPAVRAALGLEGERE